MIKQQAIDLLDNLIGMIEDNQDNDYDTAFRMAIEALKAQLSQEGTTKGTTSDTISRQAAIDALDKRFDSIPMEQTAEILKLRKDLREMQSAQPDTPCYLGSPCEYQNPAVAIPEEQQEFKVKFYDKDHVWINGKQYISLRRFHEVVVEERTKLASVKIGRSRNGTTLWYECNACGEPVDINDNYCRKCGRKLIHEDNTAQTDGSGT